VSTVDGAAALINTTVSQHGRIDVLINNAGIIRWGGLPDVEWENIQAHLDVHVGGTFNTIRAAWPHMVSAGYGRIVNTTSSGVFGLAANVGYAAAKGAVIGMTRSMAVAGVEAGIKVNAIAPAAATRMGGDVDDPSMAPDLAAPMMAFLAHEDCPVSGEIYTAGGGRFARLFVASTEGAVTNDVAANWDTINDETGYYIPADLMDWSAKFLRHQS
jgi:NAD(P)-dependent dehydrogenase (short-subunit alcohol dehydrogenase family)